MRANVAIAVLSVSVVGWLLVPLAAHRHQARDLGTCTTNVRRISAALRAYAADHDDRLPPFEVFWRDADGTAHVLSWFDLIGPDGRLRCPTVPSSSWAPYAVNGLASGLSDRDPERRLLVADGTFRALRPDHVCGRHPGAGAPVAFLDGHVEYVPRIAEAFDADLVRKEDGHDR